MLVPTRLLALSAGFTLLCVAPAARADEWAVYESDAGAADEDSADEEDFDEELEAQDFDVGGSTGPSKGPAKGPSSGPSKGACNCDVPGGGGAPVGLAGLGLLCVVGLVVRSQRGGRA